jgi:hypothetical protein
VQEALARWLAEAFERVKEPDKPRQNFQTPPDLVVKSQVVLQVMLAIQVRATVGQKHGSVANRVTTDSVG